MPIRLKCPGCGKVFELSDDLAGKKARCKCGSVISIEGRNPPAAADAEWENEIAQAFGDEGSPPAKPALQPSEPPPPRPPVRQEPKVSEVPPKKTPPSAEPPRPKLKKPRATDDEKPEPASTGFLPAWRRWKPPKKNPWPTWMAIASAIYGIAYAISCIAVYAPTWSGVNAAATRIMLGGALVYGGIQVVKMERLGALTVGLVSVLICFSPGWALLWEIVAFQRGGPISQFLEVVGTTILFYGVPAVLLVWGMRQEIQASERDKKREELLD